MVEAADAVGPTLRHFVLKAMPKGFGRAYFDPKLEERLRPVTTVLDPTTLGGPSIATSETLRLRRRAESD